MDCSLGTPLVSGTYNHILPFPDMHMQHIHVQPVCAHVLLSVHACVLMCAELSTLLYQIKQLV
jgi:hypothetical protein